jgi:lipid-binding SYLF domain-containing protein
MTARLPAFFATALTAAWLSGCGVTPNTGSADERQTLHRKCEATLTEFKNEDPTLAARLTSAYGYAIFPDIMTAAVGVGGAHGRGEVYIQDRMIGFADVSLANIGVQLGAQKYGELILFENQQSLTDFQASTLVFDARATAVAAASGAAATANYTRGVLVFTMPETGLMAQAAIGGQKFRYVAMGR